MDTVNLPDEPLHEGKRPARRVESIPGTPDPTTRQTPSGDHVTAEEREATADRAVELAQDDDRL